MSCSKPIATGTASLGMDPVEIFQHALAICRNSLHLMKQAGNQTQLKQCRMELGELVHDKDLFPLVTVESFLAQEVVWTDNVLPCLDSKDNASLALVNKQTLQNYKEYSPLEAVLLHPNINNKIFSYLGMGHYAFVGPVNKQVNRKYKSYCDSVENPPTVALPDDCLSRDPATATDTYLSLAFANMACVEYWTVDPIHAHWSPHKHLCAYVARYGTVPMMQWALANGFQWDDMSSFFAAEKGRLEMLQWLHENGCPWSELSCCAAAGCGQVECLKWLHENGCLWGERTCADAAWSGSLKCLKYAHENGCPWDVWTCRYAAWEGHLDCLKYARDNGCPWGLNVLGVAAERGSLETLKYAYENGCPYNKKDIVKCANSKYPEIQEWAEFVGLLGELDA